MIKKILNFILISLVVIPVIAQPKFDDSKLAYEYYRNKEYDKAIIFYKNLYDNSSNPRNYYTLYLNCLIQLQEYDNAEKLIKKEKRRRPNELTLLVDLGSIYRLNGVEEKAIKQYDLAIKKLYKDKNQVIRLANTFRGKREYKYAEKPIVKGRKILNSDKLFRNELAGIYQMERKIDLMVNEYLSLLSDDESNLKNVKRRLQSSMYLDINDEVYNQILSSIMIHAQRSPNKTINSELLIWLYIQKKEFDKAFYQAKALDSRLNEEGGRLMKIVQLAYSNKYYDTASEILEYILTKGPDSKYYFTAKKSQLEIFNKKVLQDYNYNLEDLLNIEKQYLNTISEFGENTSTAEIIKNLSHLQSFFLNKTDLGIKNLLLILEMKGLNRKLINQTKLELADVYLFTGNIWESALLYAQVEKDNEENPIGHEAKLRKAKLAYYSGDFLWAQAQLDVLKASTSKLIANDAFDLSVLINENTALDTSVIAMKMFSKADFYIYMDKLSEATLILDSILTQFPRHSLTDNILFKKGEIKLKEKDYSKAVEHFKSVYDNHGYDILGDNALFRLAIITEDYLLKENEAQELYKILLRDYPGSIFAVESRKRFRNLRGDTQELDDSLELNP